MLVTFFFTLLLFQQLCNIEQSFRCLIKQIGSKIIFANLTFNCGNTKINNIGCLKGISTDTLVLSYPFTEFTNLRPFISTYESYQRFLISTEFAIMKIEHKNRYKKNKTKINQAYSANNVFHLGLPILMNPNTFINNFVLTNKETHGRSNTKEITKKSISENKLDNVSVNYLLPLTYEVTKTGIKGFKINTTGYNLVFCKDLSKIKEEPNKSNKKTSFKKILNFFGVKEQISTEEQKYTKYEKCANSRSIERINLPKRYGPVLFIERIGANNESVNKLLRTTNGKGNILPSFESNFYLTLINNMWYSVDRRTYEPEDEKVIKGYNYRLISNFVLKQVDNKGEKIRKFK